MGPVTDEHKLTYTRNVELVVQQRKSRFEQAFTYHTDLKGRQAQILDLIGTTTAIIDGNRGGDTPNIDNQTEPVWVRPRQIEWGKLIEKEDQIKALTDYQSEFVQSAGAAIVRGRDTVFATGIFADRIIGQDGGSTSSYDTTSKLVLNSVGATTAMLLAKVQRAKRLLRAFYVEIDMEDLWGVVNAQQDEELYNDIIAAATTPQGKMAVLDSDKKSVNYVAGVNFVHYEGMADYDGSNYASAVWAKSGMHYGDFDPLTVTVQPNPAKKYRMHPYMENWWGVTRSEDKKVIKIQTAH